VPRAELRAAGEVWGHDTAVAAAAPGGM